MRLLVFLILTIPLFAQGKWDSIVIRYNYCIYRGDSLIFPAYTYFNREKSEGVFVIEHSKVGVDENDVDNLDPKDTKPVIVKGPDSYFFFAFKENPPLIFCREIGLGRSFPIADTEMPVWNLTKETKKILGFTCQKALTYFRSRQYEAWFTTEIPFSIGPWKLRGLGGAILEARSLDKVYSYTATSVSNTFEPVLIYNKVKKKHLTPSQIIHEFSTTERSKFMSWNEYVKKINEAFLQNAKYTLSNSKDQTSLLMPPSKQEKELDLSKEELLKMLPEYKDVIEKVATD